jgi:hypothetical protein
MYDPGTLYSDPILTDFSFGYEPQELWGSRIMPFVETSSRSARYRVFDRSDWLIYPDRREPGTVANEISGRKWSEGSFYVKEHSLQAPVFDEEDQYLNSLGGLANPTFGGALQLDPHEDATTLVTRAILLKHEKLVADTIRNTANYGASNKITLAAADQWDNYAGATSNPIDIMRAAVLRIRAATGQDPNLMLLPREGQFWLENHPDLVARFSNFSLTSEDAFRTLTGFDGEILNVDSVYNAADHIDATEIITSLWGKDVWIGHVRSDVGLLDPSFGKTFAMTYPDGTIGPVDRWREEGRKSDLVRKSMNYDVKITSSVAGYLITNAFSATAW